MKTARRDGGFTLIECVFALAVTAAALACLVTGARYAAEAESVAAARTEAATLAAGFAAGVQRGGPWTGPTEGAFEEAPAIRWKLEEEGLPAGAQDARCRAWRLVVSYSVMGDEEEEMELEFLGPAD